MNEQTLPFFSAVTFVTRSYDFLSTITAVNPAQRIPTLGDTLEASLPLFSLQGQSFSRFLPEASAKGWILSRCLNLPWTCSKLAMGWRARQSASFFLEISKQIAPQTFTLKSPGTNNSP